MGSGGSAFKGQENRQYGQQRKYGYGREKGHFETACRAKNQKRLEFQPISNADSYRWGLNEGRRNSLQF
ncbi:hypothetical protein SJ05684_c22290 [Sinorhizobium sojae CCBAU 05684]|uniref:Uncharacterized protein n=1 Tax=Sinorhizobium sojae CCBAU 05684 TaxID=716928 RepID=A0A249PCI8_9HYPH|nr:hypothetical protein SJ05684_c22290 [Sinorhizobium sojae CCBAU 05684]